MFSNKKHTNIRSHEKNSLVTRLRFLYVILSVIAVSGANAAEVTQTINEAGHLISLNAEFIQANGKSDSSPVVLLTHGALAHNRMETIRYLEQLLREKGLNTLAINLSLGISQRRGMYDCSVTHRHTNQDAIKEIEAWVNWLVNKGVRIVYLLGHSRGGAQTALYASRHNHSEVKALFLLAPAVKENTSSETFRSRYKQELNSHIKQAELFVEQGRRHALLKNTGFLTCEKATVTAESFLSYYNNAAFVDTPALLSKVKLPWLVVVAGDDQVVPGLDTKIKELVDGDKKQFCIIDGAGHMFRDLNADDAVDQIEQFIQHLNTKRNDS